MNIPKYSKLFVQLSGKRLSGKVIVGETSWTGNVRFPVNVSETNVDAVGAESNSARILFALSNELESIRLS